MTPNISPAPALVRQKRVLQIDIADLQDRYGVASATELAQRIEQGEIYSHPAWEDLIEWENLLAYLQRLTQLERDGLGVRSVSADCA